MLLELHAAKGLRDVQTLGEMDPYAVASVHPGGDKERTRTVASGGTQFRWGVGHGRRLELLLPESPRTLSVELWNENTFDDDFIGRVDCDLTQLDLSRAVTRRAFRILDVFCVRSFSVPTSQRAFGAL